MQLKSIPLICIQVFPVVRSSLYSIVILVIHDSFDRLLSFSVFMQIAQSWNLPDLDVYLV